MRRLARRFLLTLTVAAGSLALPVAGATASEEGWQALRQPGAVAIMRHALAPGTGDPANFRVDDCSTQRNLDERGRAQARAIGEAFRANGIEVDRVLSSQWCRCRDTADLLDLGPVEELPSLNSFFGSRGDREQQTEATRAFLADLAEDERAVLVTHQVNITALTGAYPSSGEVFVLDVGEDGGVEITGRILIAP